MLEVRHFHEEKEALLRVRLSELSGRLAESRDPTVDMRRDLANFCESGAFHLYVDQILLLSSS